MFELGTRSGITQAVHSYIQANNKYMSDRFNSGKEYQYLQYLDANNLYDRVMSQNLLTGRFKWVANPDKLKGCISKLAKEAGKGYLLEVDVYYPMICTICTMMSHSCVRRGRSMVSKSWFQICNTRGSTSLASWLWIMCLNVGWYWISSVEQLSLTKVHG